MYILIGNLEFIKYILPWSTEELFEWNSFWVDCNYRMHRPIGGLKFLLQISFKPTNPFKTLFWSGYQPPIHVQESDLALAIAPTTSSAAPVAGQPRHRWLRRPAL